MEALLYLLQQVEEYKTENIALSLSILSELYDLLVKSCAKKSSAKRSLSAVSKPLSEDPEVQQRVVQMKELLGRCLPVLIVYLSSQDSTVKEALPTFAPKLYRLLRCCLAYTRRCIPGQEASWSGLLSSCLQVWHGLPEGVLEGVVDLAAEAWFFCGEVPYSALSPLIDAAPPSSLAATMCKTMHSIDQGRVYAVKDQLITVLRSWTDYADVHPDLLTSFPGKNSAIDPANMLVFEQEAVRSSEASRHCLAVFVALIGLAQLGFRGLPASSLSSTTFQALRLLARAEAVLGELREDMGLHLALCRVQALLITHHDSAARQEAVSLLPGVFVENTAGDSSQSSGIEFRPDGVSGRFPAQRLCLMVLAAMHMHSEGAAYCNSLINRSPLTTSWVTTEMLWLQVLKLVSDTMRRHPDLKLWRDIDFTSLGQEKMMDPIISALESALTSGDTILADMTAKLHLRLGIAYWVYGGTLRSDKAHCHAHLLSAAKLDANDSEVYTYLGHYYWKQLGDRERGVKFYIKALTLSPQNKEAGVSCSQLYLENNQVDKAIKLWDDVNKLNPNALWMHDIRGQYHLHNGESQLAVTSYQLASEICPDDIALWMGLGYAYSMQGQYTAAQKALLRAFDLDNNNIIVLCALANSERRLGHIQIANTYFKTVLELEPNNVIALKGIGDCSLALAFQYNTMGWTSEAFRCMQTGIESVELAIEHDPSHQPLWKLLGDLYSLVSTASVFEIGGYGLFEDPSYDMSHEYLKKAEACYRKCLDLNAHSHDMTETEADIWYDIGSSIYKRFVVYLQSRGHSSGLIPMKSLLDDKAKEMMKNANAAFRNGLQANPLHSLCWNGLGLTSLNSKVQQACFVRACSIDGSAAGYANLAAALMFRGQDSLSKYDAIILVAVSNS